MLQIVQRQRAHILVCRDLSSRALKSENRPSVTCNTAQKQEAINKASPRHAGEVPRAAAHERREHTAANSRPYPAGAAQKWQKQRLPLSGGRELGGHGRPIDPRPGRGGPGVRQARAAEIRAPPAALSSKLAIFLEKTLVLLQLFFPQPYFPQIASNTQLCTSLLRVD